VDQLQQCRFLLTRERQFAVEALQSFADLRHVEFEVYGFDGAASLLASITEIRWLLLKLLTAKHAKDSREDRKGTQELLRA
jgi:hypothetical protein